MSVFWALLWCLKVERYLGSREACCLFLSGQLVLGGKKGYKAECDNIVVGGKDWTVISSTNKRVRFWLWRLIFVMTEVMIILMIKEWEETERGKKRWKDEKLDGKIEMVMEMKRMKVLKSEGDDKEFEEGEKRSGCIRVFIDLEFGPERGGGWCRIESRRFGREMYRLVCGSSGMSVRRDLAMYHRLARPHLGGVARLLNTLRHFSNHRSSVCLCFIGEQFAAAEN